ncbi:MAG: energy-coupling factor transporter transmembrane protein EcfT [Candidatus Zixiibacteriota bacterium]|nr:MAG: energy-coupling factor transporter transmembrane protein EcfT [candidate division Zixibacteria bacterium]
MTGRFILGQYRPSDSFGHRLDPRGKILFAVFLMLLSIFTSSPLFYLLMIVGITLLLLSSDISFSTIMRNSRPFVILVAVTAIYHLIFSARQSAAITSVLGFRITEGGLYMAAAFSLRVLVFISVAFFVSLTTMPADMAETLVGWLKPLKRIGIPASDIGLIVFIAMRFIPVLAEEFDTIRKAQIVRGVDFSGGLRKRARKMIFLLIPVFQSAIRRADDLAIAIESRGYISGAERSSYGRFEWKTADSCFMLSSVAVIVTLFILTGV